MQPHIVLRLQLCVFSMAGCITMSSVIPSTPGTSLSTLSSLSWKTSLRLLLKYKSMCQNLDVASSTVKYLDCESSGKMSSGVLAYYWFLSILSIALLKSFGSRHSLRLLSSFITDTIELIHSVCSCTSVMMPSLTSLSNSAL